MTAYGPPPAPRPSASPDHRARLLAMVAGGLGLLMFIWGFLTWFTESTGEKTDYGGYAAISAAPAAIGFAVAAGLVALALVFEKRPLTTVPLALAVTGLLLVIGMFIGKGSVSSGSQSADVSAGAGMVLGLITPLLQVAALAVGWLLATDRLPARVTGAWTGEGAQPGAAAQYGTPTAYGVPQGEYRQPSGYPAPQGYAAAGAPAPQPGSPQPGTPQPGMQPPGAQQQAPQWAPPPVPPPSEQPSPARPSAGQPGTYPAGPHGTSASEPTQALPTPGRPAEQPGGRPGEFPPPPPGEYQPEHPV